MDKLKCEKHNRRVFAIRGHFIHRGGWGDVCPSKKAMIGDKAYSPEEIDRRGRVLKESPNGRS